MGPYSPPCCLALVADGRLPYSLLININTSHPLFPQAVCHKVRFLILLFIVMHILEIFHTPICGITPKNVAIHISNILGEIETSNFNTSVNTTGLN